MDGSLRKVAPSECLPARGVPLLSDGSTSAVLFLFLLCGAIDKKEGSGRIDFRLFVVVC